MRYVLANFTGTHYIQLLHITVTPSTSLGWSDYRVVSSNGTVTDVGNDGTLTRGSDSYVFGSTFSGFYVEIGGQNFGIFNIHGNWVIPYNTAEFDLAASATFSPTNISGSTSLFANTLTTAANCFFEGTRIATPNGARAIEELVPGDRIVTASGGVVPLRWIWQQTCPNIFGMGDDRAPIRICADALGPGCPERDLRVTADHALMIDGLLIHAGALVNGTTIRRETMASLPATYRLWHLETEAHSVILAENCPAESFLAYTDRSQFADHADYIARFGRDMPIPELRLPRIGAARLVPPHIRAKLGITIGSAVGPLRGPAIGRAA
jgi:hypothetical protein